MHYARSPDIRLIVGLGNPGSERAGDRHNIGFWCVDLLADSFRVKFKKHRLYSYVETNYDGQHLVLAKPRTYMNASGRAVAALLARYGLRPEEMLVICDTLDLPLGRVRIRLSGGHGGSNGLRSIIADINSQDFPRIRIGIGRPRVNGQPTWNPSVVARYVLDEPTAEERRILEEAAERAAKAAQAILERGLEAAMNEYNR